MSVAKFKVHLVKVMPVPLIRTYLFPSQKELSTIFYSVPPLIDPQNLEPVQSYFVDGEDLSCSSLFTISIVYDHVPFTIRLLVDLDFALNLGGI